MVSYESVISYDQVNLTILFLAVKYTHEKSLIALQIVKFIIHME
jgi:hypothetical protein